jgi:hypothetical protein
VIIAAADEPDERASTASGFLINLHGSVFLATADHVIDNYIARRTENRYTFLQAGMLGMDATYRVVFRDPQADVAFISLAGLDISVTDATVYQPIGTWPPPSPTPGDSVQFCGFPKAFRDMSRKGEIDFGALPGFAIIQSVGPGYCTAVIDRTDVQVFGEMQELPPSSKFGGLSGGPVLLFGRLAYPIVGAVSEVSEKFDILRFATLEGVPMSISPGIP